MGKKKYGKPAQITQTQEPDSQQSNGEKRFVNLLHIYTLYKQKLRRLTKEEFVVMLCHGSIGMKAAHKLRTELMKAKEVPNIASFENNVGFLSLPRFMPLVALLAERAGYKLKPSLVKKVIFLNTPQRFQEKFVPLLVYGFWFLGRVISDSLSVKEQVNRGNMFNFAKGDMGFWWAGVKILDWNYYANMEADSCNCLSFVKLDRPKYRFYNNRAILNMHKHPFYFLSDADWDNFMMTIESVQHELVMDDFSFLSENRCYAVSISEESSSVVCTECAEVISDNNSITSEQSVNTLASRESID
ncbi:uncharacterized protein LOC124359130 [Homalodisca vitripennis]|uniref:uncharacterized protein LOC124359130 n=1 Tax=Homalodisca vitripennis TaxID=197043 RepID=UPI001EECB9AE|nr:uncharacterized protein LOC124359130 [Homalodisca vitripennis]